LRAEGLVLNGVKEPAFVFRRQQKQMQVLRTPIKTIGALRMTDERYVVILRRAACGPKSLS